MSEPEKTQPSDTPGTAGSDNAEHNPSVIEKVRQLNSLMLIGSAVAVALVLSLVITFSIEKMRSTVKTAVNNPTEQPKTAANNLTGNNIETASFNKPPPILEEDSTSPNTETATFNNNTTPRNESRIETAFEKSTKTLEDIKKEQKQLPKPPKQLQLDIQVNYTDTQWAVLSQDILQLESQWKNSLQVLTQKFAATLKPNNTLSTQAVMPKLTQTTQQIRDVPWSQVLEQMWELETLRTAMTDIFAQQLYPQTPTMTLSQLSTQLSPTNDTVTWQQVLEQILTIEEYRADMLKTADNVF